MGKRSQREKRPWVSRGWEASPESGKGLCKCRNAWEHIRDGEGRVGKYQFCSPEWAGCSFPGNEAVGTPWAFLLRIPPLASTLAAALRPTWEHAYPSQLQRGRRTGKVANTASSNQGTFLFSLPFSASIRQTHIWVQPREHLPAALQAPWAHLLRQTC